ncbi:hypothetical protein EsH8_VI_001058 [Colletotrichum jinshuiense]
MKCDRALQCFVGGWGFLNATLTNSATGELIPEWHSIYPSGISVYSASGYISFIITANDTTQTDVRPREVTLPAQPGDSNDTWALVAQHSLGVGGTYSLSNITCDGGKGKGGKYNQAWKDWVNKGKGWGWGASSAGPSGLLTVNSTTATLPSYVGGQLVNTFEFTEDCSKHVLVADFGGAYQTVWFYRLPQLGVFA